MVMGEGATLRAFMSAAVRHNFGCLKTPMADAWDQTRASDADMALHIEFEFLGPASKPADRMVLHQNGKSFVYHRVKPDITDHD